MLNLTDTIAAIATPNGVGALGAIRISGHDAIDKISIIFNGKDISSAPSHTLHFGKISAGNEVIDEVLVSIFRSPNSYTGENSAEISCHGSPYILQKIMEALAAIGVRQAEAGEFTMRAFMNGKLDLSQAEAVADLINSDSKAAHHSALYQLRGGVSNIIKQLRAELVHFGSLIELELDFAEEDVAFANRKQLISLLHKIKTETENLINTFSAGNAIKKGVNVVITGRPNAGKSTLLNALLNEEKALVSPIPGTTRDAIEDTLFIDGILFRFTDTAGIRNTSDALEEMGIERTLKKIEEAAIIFYLFDVNTASAEDITADIASLHEDIIILKIGNKTDEAAVSILNKFSAEDTLFISAKTGENIDELKKILISKLHLGDINTDRALLTNQRHYQSLLRVKENIISVIEGMQNDIPNDLLSIDLRSALHHLGQITGEVTTDEILGNIFSKFCIGK